LNHSRGGIFHSSSGHAPGHRFDTIGVPPLIDKLSFGALIADEGSDSDAIIADLNKQGAKVVIRAEPADRRKCTNGAIPSRTSSPISRSSNASPCADKIDESFSAISYLATAVINSQ
jgi:hypothetical protein